MQTAVHLERLARNMKHTRMLQLIGVSLVSLILLLPASALAASVNLRWNANTEPDIGSYNVYYGEASRTYGNPIPVGNVTSYRVDGLEEGRTYYFTVTALDTSGNESGYSPEESATASSSEPPEVILQPTAVSLSASMNSPQVEGTAVQFTASASGGSGNYEYKFWERGPATADQWRVVRNYSTSDTYTWDTTNKIGTTSIGVEARNAGTTIDSYSSDRTDTISFTITSGPSQQSPQPTSITLNSNVSSPQVSGTSVVFTASASGGSGNYEYRFSERGPSTGYQWQVIRDYSASRSLSWDTSGKVGDNRIAVLARNVGTTDDSRIVRSLLFTIDAAPSGTPNPAPEQPTSVTLWSSRRSPEPEGVVVQFTASASGGSGDYEYRFSEKGPSTGNQWRVIHDYSASRYLSWDTSGKVGDTRIAVIVRSVGTTDDSRIQRSMLFRVTQ